MDANFKHKIDKSKIPYCKILGVKVSAINMDWLIAFTKENIKKLSGDYVCVANVHTTVTAYEDKEYRMIQNGGILTIPDGGPLASLGRKRGHQEMARTTGPSYMTEMLSQAQGYRHFFYGATPETLKKLKAVLAEKYPNAEIVGMISPPFRPLTDMEDAEIMEKINHATPDFVWVGLGAPKQEKWMAEHQGRICGLMVGVGAGFDYLAGNIKRAPKWMQDLNLEWFYRLLQEPKRLFKRYLITNTKYIWHAVVRGR
ncbi:MAG: WecB/TagA/CpsF family glycosyltransferase [Acetatifactor sp.]|nr:WecB/TagA/CpsF family glycosyltransferase [Acetatifactor sp.]